MREKFSLQNMPLAKQIFLLFLSMTIVLGASVAILYPYTLKQILLDNTYSLLEDEFEKVSDQISFTQQHELVPLPSFTSPRMLMLLLQNYNFSFQMMVFSKDGQLIGFQHMPKEGVPLKVATGLFKEASAHKGSTPYKGSTEWENENFLMVSQKMDYFGFPYYLVIFTKEKEIIQINNMLTKQFFIIFAFFIFVSLLLAGWFSGYLSTPLRRLEESCQKIARRQFDIPLMVDRKDEIGQLARSFDMMKKQLKDHDESQQHFVQNISHELKTPIMAIQGYAQGLIDGVFQGAEAQKGLSIIMEESNRLENVVEQLLYLTKVESVDKMMTFTSLDLTEMIGLLHQRYHLLHPHLAWQIEIPKTLPMKGDGEQLYSAFTNIVENQLRYAKTTITITAKVVKEQIEIAISNDGPPIEESVMPYLFQRFRKGKTGKHGLGLAIARAVLEAHGGSITAKNISEQQGVMFIATLPQKQSHLG
ncbi:HAMP domain-containing sensor histidine kinase [Brevibacillus laterosporus]|uniref:HAMP domain-containing sensor histidine kinase n=1 Tax=Brevibacillus laterosporus TaxID=1465 RepID=UPI0003B2174A|nr:HAMP domain-containing sensor histidine kinase [Brevibacillus laterosporus]ERM19727.1 histidine kinase [Brevibacillus laterosporus PE36]